MLSISQARLAFLLKFISNTKKHEIVYFSQDARARINMQVRKIYVSSNRHSTTETQRQIVSTYTFSSSTHTVHAPFS